MALNCKPEKSRECGKACIGWTRRCKNGDNSKYTGRPAKVPGTLNCKPEKSRECGKACVGWNRRCKNGDNSKYVNIPKKKEARAPDQYDLKEATEMRKKADRAYNNKKMPDEQTARYYRLRGEATMALLRAVQQKQKKQNTRESPRPDTCESYAWI